MLNVPISPNAQLCFLPEQIPNTWHWQGGELFWLLPERGPGLHDISLLRRVLNLLFLPKNVPLKIIVCLPSDQTEREANDSKDSIINSVIYHIPPSFETVLEFVWIDSDNHSKKDINKILSELLLKAQAGVYNDKQNNFTSNRNWVKKH